MKLPASLTLSVLCAAAAFGVCAADDVTRARFPDADSVVVDESERVAYNPDGTYETFSESFVKILTEKGRREESTVSLSYSKRYAEAEILYVGAVGADGREREIDVRATTKESTDNGSVAANIYDPLDRRIVCTVPGLRIGETLHVKTRRKATKARCQNAWADLSVMEWSHPILRSTYEVTAPAARPLRKIAIRHPLGNVTTSERRLADGSTVHTFVCTNSPQAFPEPDMPPLYTQVQNVRVSTMADWPEVSRWYWDLCAPHLAKTNAAMAKKVAELKAGAKDPIRAIFKFVSQEVRYMGLTMEDTSPGYAPHDVDVTFDNRYGVCRDKAGLLVAMLRLAGYRAFPVLINVGAKLDPEVPQPFFNHAVVAVEETPGAYVLMDPTNESTKDIFPAYESNMSYLVCRPEGDVLRTTPVPSPDLNALKVDSRGTLSDGGSLFFESDIRFDGINDTVFRRALLRRTAEERVKFFEGVVKKLSPGAELIRCAIEPEDMRDTEKALRVRLASRLPEAVLRGETRAELAVPTFARSIGLVNMLLAGSTSLESRKYPLVLSATASVEERLSLPVAALGRVLDLPRAERLAGGYGYVRTLAVTNGTLTSLRRAEVASVEFSPAEYVRLREDIKRTEAAERRRPVFAVDPLENADVNVLADETEVSVHSDRAWTVTNRVTKQVLTYAGKKGSAELKFSYNPAVETVELACAVVSNRDGRVSVLADRERNVLDCGWAASAPRYPAGKTLVANLPSVEIGSVISYTFVRAVTNAAAAYYGSFAFDSKEPLGRRLVRVNDWRREVVRPARVPDEPSQPYASLWRDRVVVASNRFERMDLAIEPTEFEVPGAAESARASSLAGVKAIRDWMARYVRVTGPGIWDLPLAQQLTPPKTVLKERYATRLDYVRTLCALLRGAGYEADVVFAADTAGDPPEMRRRLTVEQPNVRAFLYALCRVTLREGGFLGLGGRETVYFIGTENHYAPLGPSAHAGDDYFEPETGDFGVVTVPETAFEDAAEETSEILVRENGAVDITNETRTYGSGVGAFRKTYAEMLPENRARRYQAMLGAVAQAASATSELETDVDGYPARRKFSCYVPDYATVAGDAITLQVPPLLSSLPTITGEQRRTPFALGATDRGVETVVVRFPEGYTAVEHLPERFVFSDPLDATKPWLEQTVTTAVRDGCLEVRLVRTVHAHDYAWYEPHFIELIRDRDRLADARANRTIVVRKAGR